jgi:glycerate-2-kinase
MTNQSAEPRLRSHAREIWAAGVRAVDSERLVGNAVHRDGAMLDVWGHRIDLSRTGRIAVVGAGKAGAGMAAAFEAAVGPATDGCAGPHASVGPDVADAMLSGWVNVPADCVRPLQHIHLHAARPAGVNEPTEDGVAGARRILEIVRELTADDVCIVLLSGGGSALLPAPVPQISLADKQAVTRSLMHAGATIGELNCVRKQLSEIKGGRLAKASGAGLTIALIISDVIGDPLDVIASGPTVDDSSTPADALFVLRDRLKPADVPEPIVAFLQSTAGNPSPRPPFPETVHNHVIGNNAVALEAAAEEARRRGFAVHSLGSNNAGEARGVGVELAELAAAVRDGRHAGCVRAGASIQGRHSVSPPACILSGGEPVVHLANTDRSRKGGRNQELVLAAVRRLWDDGMAGIALLSGGTDGEDGPTDAAGAVADAELISRAKSLNLAPDEFLAINNSYPFFEQTDSLLKTGPTHTNVMDLRVVVVAPHTL